MKKFLILLLSLLPVSLASQNLVNSRQSSYYTYIFRITNSQASEINHHESLYLSHLEKFMVNVVDSFPTGKTYRKKLLPGHYLQVYARGNNLETSYAPVEDIDPEILDNKTDLIVQLHDTTGSVVKDASVRCGNRQFKYDNELNAFVLKKSNKKGLLEVKYGENIFFFDLNRNQYNPLIKRAGVAIIGKTPLKYAWRPVALIGDIPVDLVRLASGSRPRYSLPRIRSMARSFAARVDLIFDKYSYHYFDGQYRYRGYFVFNKPKYLPGDTVRLKAYISDRKGNPLSRELDLFIEKSYDERIKLASVKPLTPGNYNYSFIPNDSLGLDMDKHYRVFFEKKRARVVSIGYFSIEDYELKSTQLEVKAPEIQYRGRKYEMKIKGTDENALNILDGRLEILARGISVAAHKGNNVFMPDTLLFIEKKLETEGETNVTIPDSVFPAADLNYNIEVKLLRSDNETRVKKITVNYCYEKKEFKHELENDTLVLYYLVNSDTVSAHGTIAGIDLGGNEYGRMIVDFPCRIPLNPWFRSYKAKAGAFSSIVQIPESDNGVACYSLFGNDSISFSVTNPRKLSLVYHFYKGNKLIRKGTGENINFKEKADRRYSYYLMLNYLWAGITQNQVYVSSSPENKLTVEAIQPSVIMPGQKVNIEVNVKDSKGNPVEGADVTAYSLTSKFSYAPPAIPEYDPVTRRKNIINSFHLGYSRREYSRARKLDYEAWEHKAALDTITYYHFLYPDSELTSFYYHPADSKTQFSPFILKNGEPETIHYIILDKKPLYFRWAGTTGNQYSFEASPGYHLLELRTSERKFVIDSIYLAPGMKLVLAVKDMMHPASYSAVKEKNVLSETEKKSLGKWMFSYRNNFEGYLAYMKQDNRIFLLNGTGGMANSYNGYSRYDEESLTNVAGPVSSSSATLVVPAKYKVEFTPEAGYSNEFSAGLLKMRSISMYDKLPSKLTGYPVERFTDLPLSEEMMNRMHADDMYKKKMATAKFTIPSITAPGYCYLQLEFDSTFRTAGREPVLILVIPNSDLARMSVFPGNTRAINNQQPGLTSIILWYRDDSHLRYDSIMLKRDGKNYVRLTWSDKRIPPDEGVMVKDRMEAKIFSTGREPDPSIVNSWKANLTKQYLLTNLGPGMKVSGTVSSNDGPVPGAIVEVKGTGYGTLTDINGNYSINVPDDSRTLVFSFIGFRSEEIEVTSDVVNVMMVEDVLALQEVVVVGYGISRKRELAGSVSVVSALSGKVAGVQVGSPGAKDKVVIRGNRSFSGLDQPLVIIDGIPYTGDLSALDPNFIRDIKVLKDESLTSLYGSRASNGVILISTSELKKAGKPIPAFITEFIKMQFPEGEEQGTSGIRSFFRDYAYWKPDLVTNENGAASFIAKFPDDVTSWNSYFLVMKGKKSGSHTASVKSYKSLMAQLFVPRFLVEGDSSGLVGKVLNYSSDTVKLKTIFELDNKQVEEKERTCTKSLVDTLEVIAANTDTIIARYYFKKTDGYSDGEERKVPVFKRGIEKTVGEFIVLEGDTAITVKPGKGLGKVSVYAQSDAVGIINDEIRYLEDYRYNCNEQLASKLIALVSSGKIARSAGKKFNDEQKIRRIIKTLESNANDDGAWGWWNRSGTADWVTIHVTEALLEARKEGYKVAFRTEDLLSYVVWTLESSKDKALNLHLLYIAKLSGFKLDYNKYIDQIDSQSLKALADKFLLIRLMQLTGLKYDTGIIYKNSYTTLFGNVAFGSEDNRDSFTDNRTQATINAYQVLAADSTVSRAYLSKIRNYFFECRRLGTWQNTYESARIIKTILPDLLSSSGGIITQPELAISGKVNTVIKKFPYEVSIDETDTLAIRKSGSFPVYLTYYQRYFEKDPSPDSSSFTIRSSFADANLVMKAGKQEKLVVDLAVKRDAQFTVVEIPIPAGCTYDEKENYFEGAVHSEFHKDRVSVFYNFMKRGDYRFEISLLPRYTGSYTLNPAKAELMYFPVFSGNNELKQVQIK